MIGVIEVAVTLCIRGVKVEPRLMLQVQNLMEWKREMVFPVQTYSLPFFSNFTGPKKNPF